MKLLRASARRPAASATPLESARRARRGAALLLSFMVLIVIVAITYQIHMVTKTDAKVAHNEMTRAAMDLAIESALLQVLEDLAEDARAAQASESESGAGGAAPGETGGAPPGENGGGAPTQGGAPGAPGAPGEPESNAEAVDSQMDGWYTPASTSFNDIQVNIFIRDEDSKYNVLNLLQPNEDIARECFERVVRILDYCREGTEFDIPTGEAEEMTRAMLDHMKLRDSSALPRTPLLNDVEDDSSRGFPQTLREFRAIEPFRDDHFFEGYDANGDRVHGIDAFLTIFTSPALGDDAPAAAAPVASGGYTVNLNTAPRAVLEGLHDRRIIPARVWEQVLEYRNEAEPPPEEEEEEVEPLLDEFGNEVVKKKIFDSLDELEEVYEFKAMLDPEKTMVRQMLGVQSHVFEIVLTARLPTIREEDRILEFTSRREQEEYYRSGAFIVRTVRAVYWRAPGEDDVKMIPLVRWEVLENAPLQVLDYPDDRL